jgi:hypothetical protein
VNSALFAPSIDSISAYKVGVFMVSSAPTKYGVAIYCTRGGPFTNGKWGRSTHRGNTVYVQVFDWPGDTLRLGALPQKIVKA